MFPPEPVEWIKPNANLFRTKSLLLRSGSINLLRNCLQRARHESYLLLAFITFKMLSANIRGNWKWRNETLSTRISFNAAPVERTRFTVSLLLDRFMLLLLHISLQRGLEMIIERMKINCFASFRNLLRRWNLSLGGYVTKASCLHFREGKVCFAFFAFFRLRFM